MKGIAIALSLSVALCGVVHAQSLRSDINRTSKVIRKYMMKRDADGFKNYVKGAVTSDFQYVENGQTQTFDQMCEGMKMGFAQFKKISRADSTIVKLNQKGDTGVATMLHRMAGTSMPGPDKKTHKMTFSGTSEDTYVKENGKWKMAKMAWVKQTILMDGKPIPAGAMGGQN